MELCSTFQLYVPCVTLSVDLVGVVPATLVHVRSLESGLPSKSSITVVVMLYEFAAFRVKLLIVMAWPEAMLVLSSVRSPPPPVAVTVP